MENPPTSYHALKGKERESKVDVLVEAGPAGEEPAQAEHHHRVRSPARQVCQPADHPRHRTPADPSSPGPKGARVERFELTIPPNHFLDFGFRLEIEPISGIRKDSPAEKAGFRKGDRIIKVDGAG